MIPMRAIGKDVEVTHECFEVLDICKHTFSNLFAVCIVKMMLWNLAKNISVFAPVK